MAFIRVKKYLFPYGAEATASHWSSSQLLGKVESLSLLRYYNLKNMCNRAKRNALFGKRRRSYMKSLRQAKILISITLPYNVKRNKYDRKYKQLTWNKQSHKALFKWRIAVVQRMHISQAIDIYSFNFNSFVSLEMCLLVIIYP